MIELRWREAEDRDINEYRGMQTNRFYECEPNLYVLQYRYFIPGGAVGGRWSEWADVPTPKDYAAMERDRELFGECHHEHVCSDGMCLLCGEGGS